MVSRQGLCTAVTLLLAGLLAGEGITAEGSRFFQSTEPTAATTSALDWTIGSWKGTRRAAADGSEAPLTANVERLIDMPGQAERIQVESQPRGYVGFAVRTQSPSGGRWLMVYGNSNRESFATLSGVLDGDGSTWTSITPGRTRESRLVFERPSPDRWRRIQLISEDTGKTWQVLFTDDLQRVSAAR